MKSTIARDVGDMMLLTRRQLNARAMQVLEAALKYGPIVDKLYKAAVNSRTRVYFGSEVPSREELNYILQQANLLAADPGRRQALLKRLEARGLLFNLIGSCGDRRMKSPLMEDIIKLILSKHQRTLNEAVDFFHANAGA